MAELVEQKVAVKSRIREREEKIISFWEGLPGIALGSGLALAGGYLAGKVFGKKKESHHPLSFLSAIGGGGNPLTQVLVNSSLMGINMLLDRLHKKREAKQKDTHHRTAEADASAS